MVQATTQQMTVRGTIRGGRIVFDVPLDLPDGTEVTLDIQVIGPARSTEPSAANSPAGPAEVPSVLTDEELHDWVIKHPAPQSWWDATDNPFEPAPAADDRQPARPDAGAEG